ncbi:MAG: potassium channel family protein [Gammaproteobacteria bacterium]|nr:potassium channel family protein [Gammaproteobacteria bacterium]MDH5734845.1 potassium channel family protein [Gammaproteobacteria bacterium]
MIEVFLVNILIIALAVLIHYECLYRMSIFLPRLKIKHRFLIVLAVFGALVAHIIEIWFFAIAYYLLPRFKHWGELTGNFDGSFMDCVYFSYTTYTTLGFGDIEPYGHIRHLVGFESLTGLVLITWTASFIYYEMHRYWGR